MIQLNYNYAKLRMHAEKNEQGALWRFLYWLSYYVLFLPILKLVTSLHLLSHPTKQVHVVPVGSRVSVHIIPALWTNYCYLVIDQQTKEAVAIDPVDATAVLREASRLGVSIKLSLTTHHHWDHSGGNVLLRGNVPVYCSAVDFHRTPGATDSFTDEQQLCTIGCLQITPILTPCHTRGHVVYHIQARDGADTASLLFSGDCLFSGGCGKFFEGTASEMWHCFEKIKRLPSNTLVFPGHEYTRSNLQFCLYVDGSNDYAAQRLKEAIESMKKGLPTVPSTLRDELSYNVFLRAAELPQDNPHRKENAISTLAHLRSLKDKYSPPKI